MIKEDIENKIIYCEMRYRECIKAKNYKVAQSFKIEKSKWTELYNKITSYEKRIKYLELELDNEKSTSHKYINRCIKGCEWIYKHIDKFKHENLTIYDWDSLSDPKALLKILGGEE